MKWMKNIGLSSITLGAVILMVLLVSFCEPTEPTYANVTVVSIDYEFGGFLGEAYYEIEFDNGVRIIVEDDSCPLRVGHTYDIWYRSRDIYKYEEV